jgi:hypothetical protein
MDVGTEDIHIVLFPKSALKTFEGYQHMTYWILIAATVSFVVSALFLNLASFETP